MKPECRLNNEAAQRRPRRPRNQNRKLLLNPLHREGQHKARVFASALGITPANAEMLRRAIMEAAIAPGEAESRGDNGFGEVFVLRFPMQTETGSAAVLTAWIIRHSEDFPRLTTCYIL